MHDGIGPRDEAITCVTVCKCVFKMVSVDTVGICVDKFSVAALKATQSKNDLS